MTANSRFFIIRPDGTTSTVNGEQLAQMRQSGFVGPDDKVIPTAMQEKAIPRTFFKNTDPFPKTLAFTPKFIPALDDIDTAPLEFRDEHHHVEKSITKTSSHDFGSLDDIEIDQAFSSAISRSLYQLQAKRAQESFTLAGSDKTPEINKAILDGRPLYNIRFADGRVIGPFDTQNIWQRFFEQTLAGNEEFALAGSEDFKPLRSKVEFRAALKIFKDSLSPPSNVDIHRIGPASIAPLLLQLAHQLVTGWLIVKSDTHTKVLSLSVGRLLHIRSNEIETKPSQGELNELFAFEDGIAWFEADPLSAADENTISEDVLSLCRTMTSVASGFSLSRIVKTLGEQNRALQLKNVSSWKEQLTEIEQEATLRAEQGKTIHATLHELFSLGASEEDSVHALFMIFITGCVTFISEKVTHDIKELANKLASNDFLELLSISLESNDEDIHRELEGLRVRISEAAKLLPAKDPLRQQMRDRFADLEDIALNPMKRYIALRTKELGDSVQDDGEFALSLQKEYLEKSIQIALAQKRYLETLADAERLHELTPDSVDSLSYVYLARFFSAATKSDREVILNSLKKSLKRLPSEPTLLLAAASILIHAREYKRAHQVISELLQLLPEDERVLTLQRELDSLRAAPSTQAPSSSMRAAHALFATVITLAMTALLWMLAVDLELGKSETMNQKIDDFIWLRSATLVGFAAIGFVVLRRQNVGVFFTRLRYKTSFFWLIGALLVGVLLGAMLDIHSVTNQEFSSLSLTAILIAVLFERLYFSGFLAHDLLHSMKSRFAAVILIATLYTLYYFSFYEVLATPMSQMSQRLVAIGLGLSLPLAVIQLATRSITVPLLFHLSFVVAAYWVTHFGERGWFFNLW